jgi:adenylate cyclase
LKRISAITRYKLRKLLKYALVTATVGAVLTLFGGTMNGPILLGWIFLGTWTGILEEFLFGRRFRSLAVPLQFIGKALAVNLFTIALIGIALLASRGHSFPFVRGVWQPFGEVVDAIGTYRFALQVVVITSVAILVVQVEEFMGRRFFMGFLLGWYDKPREAERVVLSIDLVGSSALNERLGDMLYFRFLNTTHSLMTDAVLRHDAEIHKYVGDEVIFTWNMRTGIHHHNCLQLFFDIRERLEMHRQEMMREFGVAPEFRGGLHGGRVITAQVGHIKRAIDLSGDVMNTVSRVQSMGKNMKADLMITQDLLDRMPDADAYFDLGEPVHLRVKGGKRQMTIRSVERKKSRTEVVKEG